MRIREIIAAIEVFAAPELQEEYDNARLLTGDPDRECSGALCCLDVTIEVVQECISNKCNIIIAHHPVIFKGMKAIRPGDQVSDVLIMAIRNDIAIYAAHTNLDNILLGVNGKIAEKLGLNNIRILAPKRKVLRRLITFAPHDQAEKVRDAVFAAGAGHIGKYSECSFNSKGEGTFKAEEGADPYVGEVGKRHQESETKIEIVYPFYLESQVVDALVKNHPYEEVAYDIFTMENVHLGIGSGIIGDLATAVDAGDLLGRVKKIFGTPAIRYTGSKDKKIGKVAVCGGAGSFLIPNAMAAGADILITSDIKYHEFFSGIGKMMVADIGHYESEQFTIDLIHDLILQKFPTFAVLKTGVNTNPVRYFI
jgi:dinuclear metal center YbgI/SA1388 family protein